MSEDGPSSSSGEPPQAVTLVVELVRHGGAWDDIGISDATAELAAHAAFTVASPGATPQCSVTVVLTDDKEMRDLNRKWRDKDAPTNVLAFPTGNAPDFGMLGDIVIAFETVRTEAKETGVSISDHVSHLVVHGVLHLLGFDHLTDTDARRMEGMESKALASIGIADPYRNAEETNPQETDLHEAPLAEIAR